MQNPENVTNPGVTNVADQGDGPLSVDQPVQTGTPQVANLTVQGGTFSPQSPDTEDVAQDQVATQVYGSPYPENVYP